MGIVTRQGLKSTIATYLGVLVGAFNLLWLYPKFLTPEEIGLTRVILDIALVFAVLSQIGATNITDKFFSFYKDENKKHHGFFMLLLIYPLFGFLIISILYLLLKDLWIEAYEDRSAMLLDYIIEVIPLAFFIMYMNVLEAYSRVHFRIVIPSFIREVFLRVFMTAIVILYYLKFISLDDLIILIIMSYVCAVVLLLGYIQRMKIFFLSSGSVLYNKEALKQMIIFGLFIFLGGASGILATKIDIIMLGSMENLNSAGIYSIAFFMGTIIEVPRRAISQITTPLISQAWKNNDLKLIGEIYFKTSLNQFIVGILLFLLIWCNVDDLLALIPNSDKYLEGKYVILIIALGRLTDMVTGVNTEIILNSSYYKFNLFLIVASSAFLIVLNYFLIPVYGMNGAALSILIILLLFNIIKGFFLFIKFKLQPFSQNTFYVLVFGLLSFAIVYFLPQFDGGYMANIINIGWRSAVIVSVFMGMVLYFKMSQDVNLLVVNFLKKLKR
ncbi:MAG: polysaccharide biosynthesis C-terminal domain-containing protein [Cytophagaceae bacterium]|nr:polysaccharide biosynthesis C-terminal domain-containing protein [Cytophagaceae bacterium]